VKIEGLFFKTKEIMMFDIDDPDYEKDVVGWIKKNLPICEEKYVEDTVIVSNNDFCGAVIKIAYVNDQKVLILKLPNDVERIYYPKVVETMFNERLDRYIVDDLFWFYRERCTNIFTGEPLVLCSFGMDMSMPFLSL